MAVTWHALNVSQAFRFNRMLAVVFEMKWAEWLLLLLITGSHGYNSHNIIIYEVAKTLPTGW